MKKFIGILICLLISVTMLSQSTTIIIPQKPIENIEYTTQDKLSDLGFGLMVSASGTLLAYEGLYRFTNTKEWKCKFYAWLAGQLINGTVTYFRHKRVVSEGYTFDKYRVNNHLYGGVIGANVVFLIGKDKRRKEAKEKLKQKRFINY